MEKNQVRTENNNLATLTIKIDGPYFPLEKFRKFLDSFSVVLSEIDKETSDTGQIGVEWSILSVTQGSIQITAEANIISDDIEIERPYKIIDTFKLGLEKIKESPQRPLYFNTRALQNVKNFSDLISPEDFAEIKFSTEQWRFNVTKNISVNIDEITQNFYTFYGSIEGELVSISIANRKKMGIRSLIEHKTVTCFFPEELLNQAKDALGKRVYVFGLIRQYLHGEKINIKVQELKLLPEPDESFTLANIISSLRGEN